MINIGGNSDEDLEQIEAVWKYRRDNHIAISGEQICSPIFSFNDKEIHTRIAAAIKYDKVTPI